MSETDKPTISQTLKAGIALMPSLATAKPKVAKVAGPSSDPTSPNAGYVAKVTVAPAPAPIMATKPVQVTGPHVVIPLPNELAAKLAKPVTGQGGWQTMLTTLQGYMYGEDGVYLLTLPDSYVTGKLVPLTVKYGGGGYQSMVRHIVCLWLAAKGGI